MSETPTYKRIIEERLSHEIFSNDYLVKDSATEGTTRILISEFIDLILADSPTEEDLAKILNDLAPEFSTQYSYTSGNIVIYQEQLYEFTASKPAGNWDNSKVTQKSVSQLIADVKSTLGTRINNEETARQQADTALGQRIDDEATARQNMDNQLVSGIGKQMSNLADFYVTTKSYVVGDVVMQQSGELIRCIAPTSGEFDNTKWEQVTVDELFDDLNFSADAISYDNTSSGLEADDVQDAIGETITKLSAVGSASGDIATFPDGSDLSMPKLEVAIEPVQAGSGDPSPENIRPISGWDEVNLGVVGKNKLKNKLTTRTYNGVTATVKDDGTITLTGTATQATNFFINAELNFTGNYVISGCPSGGSDSSYYINALINNQWGAKGKDYGNGIFSNGGTITNVAISVANGYSFPSGGLIFKPMIESGNIKTTYEPYNGNTYTIDLDGTRYGGKVDLVSGVMTVTHGYVDLGTLTWTYNTSSSLNPFFYAPINGIKSYGAPYNVAINAISSLYKVVRRTQADFVDGRLCGDGTVTEILQIQVKDSRYSDATAFTQAMSGVQLVYELATPLTIQLTPTVVKSLRGINNVWADTGDVIDAEYVRDATSIINDILARLEALENA